LKNQRRRTKINQTESEESLAILKQIIFLKLNLTVEKESVSMSWIKIEIIVLG